ncbi:MAG: hypothetical protein E6R07_07300 [Nevskiaceae bacterium]|nr:MAG: hypothetical protein E6R07_07300 [Nevskiaceae bacterium]
MDHERHEEPRNWIKTVTHSSEDNEHPNLIQLNNPMEHDQSLARLQELRELLAEAQPPPIMHVPSDEDVIADEHAFRSRFGIGFDWPKLHRAALIRLKHRYDLTDREIKLSRITGNLRPKGRDVILDGNRWVAFGGWAQLVAFGGLLVFLVLATWPNLIAGNPHAWKGIGYSCLIVGFCYAIYWTHIMPWQLLKRAEAFGLPNTP